MNDTTAKPAVGRNLVRLSATTVTVISIAGALWLPVSDVRANDADAVCAPRKLESADKVNLQALPARLIYVDFWASWCVPCKQSFPFMNTLKKQFEGKGLSILAISVDKDIDEARAFLRENPATFPIAHDASGRCAKQFAVKGMPSSYIVSKTGQVLYTHKGFRPSDTAEITRQLQSFIDQVKE